MPLEVELEISSRTTSPKRRRRSSCSTASSRSSASSETSKSASRVTRNIERSTISMPGKSRSRKWAITLSSGSNRPFEPAGKKRGNPSGTFTRAKRSSPLSGSRASTPRLRDRPEMYGKRCPGPTPSGVSTGKISRWKRSSSTRSSSASRSPIAEIVIPSCASAGESDFFQSFDCCAVSSRTRSRMRARASRGVSPSTDRTATPEAA